MLPVKRSECKRTTSSDLHKLDYSPYNRKHEETLGSDVSKRKAGRMYGKLIQRNIVQNFLKKFPTTFATVTPTLVYAMHFI